MTALSIVLITVASSVHANPRACFNAMLTLYSGIKETFINDNCPANIFRLLNKLSKKPFFDINKARVLYILPQNQWLYAFHATNYDPWKLHVVLEYKGQILDPHFDHVKSTKPTAEYLAEMFFFDSENSERLFNQYRPEHYSNEDFLKNYSIRSIPASDYLRDFSETPEKGKHTFNFYKNDEAGIYYPSSPISKYLDLSRLFLPGKKDGPNAPPKLTPRKAVNYPEGFSPEKIQVIQLAPLQKLNTGAFVPHQLVIEKDGIRYVYDIITNKITLYRRDKIIHDTQQTKIFGDFIVQAIRNEPRIKQAVESCIQNQH